MLWSDRRDMSDMIDLGFGVVRIDPILECKDQRFRGKLRRQSRQKLLLPVCCMLHSNELFQKEWRMAKKKPL